MAENTVIVLLLIILLETFLGPRAELITRPRDTEALVGSKTYLNCSTSDPSNGVMWYYYIIGNPHNSIYIYMLGQLQKSYKGSARVEKHSDTGSFDLVFDSAQRSDAGKYVCQEEGESGQYSSAELIILDGPLHCKVPEKEGGFVGPNTCGLEREDIPLYCGTGYHGNIPPKFIWKSDLGELNGHGISQHNEKNNATSTLTLRGDSVLSQSTYICQTTRSAVEEYSCNIQSAAFKTIYTIDNFSISQMSVGENVTCVANSSQPCTYKWIKNKDGHDSIVSNNSTVTFESKGMHRCEAECTIRRKQYRVISRLVLVDQLVSSELSESTGMNGWMIGFILLSLFLNY